MKNFNYQKVLNSNINQLPFPFFENPCTDDRVQGMTDCYGNKDTCCSPRKYVCEQVSKWNLKSP